MTTETEVQRLNGIASATAAAVREMARERDEKASEAAQAVRSAYGHKLRPLRDAHEAAANAAYEARVAAVTDHKWEGQYVTREETQHSRYTGGPTGLKTIRGLVRTYRPGVELPMNRNNYVSIGDVLVFALKKDGTAGKDYEKFSRHEADWTLEPQS